MNKSESIVKLAEATALAQAEMPPVKFNSTNPFLKNKYADLGAIIETSQPVLAKYGLSVSQLVYSEGDQVGVETILMHKSGEWISTKISLAPADEKGKSNAQLAGSNVTYLRRYSLAAILNMYADEDGDGNKPQVKQEWKPEPVKVEVKPESEPQPEAPFTLADALHHENSEGTPYGELTSNKLAIMWNAMNKSIVNNHLEGDEKAKLERKMRAAKMIMDARKSGEIAEVK